MVQVIAGFTAGTQSRLNAGIGGIGPFQLHRVAAKRLGFPRADVADFSVGIVIPAGAGNGIRDGLAKFVGRGGRERVGNSQAAFASGAAGIGHRGIKNIIGSGVVIAAKSLAGFCAALVHLRAGWQENEIERIGSVCRKCAGGNFSL